MIEGCPTLKNGYIGLSLQSHHTLTIGNGIVNCDPPESFVHHSHHQQNNLTWSNSNLCLTVGCEQYQYIVGSMGCPRKVAPIPHLQHVLLANDPS